jgi:hypothetical protein
VRVCVYTRSRSRKYICAGHDKEEGGQCEGRRRKGEDERERRKVEKKTDMREGEDGEEKKMGKE